MDAYLSGSKRPAGTAPGNPSSKHARANPHADAMDAANRRVFGNVSFRVRQEAIIEAVLSNKDVFVIMPTGGGKSLCFQLPAVLSPGITVVVSPLLSLIEDQVSALLQLPGGGVPSAYLCSTCTPDMEKGVYTDLERADKGLEPYLKLLYVTPERLVNHLGFKDRLLALYNNEMLARFVIDEAHCVSSWGHDFRKDYKGLSLLKKEYPETPIVALTATARGKVMDDTMKILGIKNSAVTFSAGFDRPNLYFEVRHKPSSTGETHREILAYIMQDDRWKETGIVYCMTKKDAEAVSDFLVENKIQADYYHAGQTLPMRKLVQGAWSRGEIKVVCATIAYGMGIDKPNVRYVLHMSLAKSLEGYYQEAGRAGRDNQRSECIMFYRHSDVGALSRLMMKPPARTLSKGDADRLEEMQEYCEMRLDCRRKTFAHYFGNGGDGSFSACGNMCDNCIRGSGGKLPTANSDSSTSAYGSSRRSAGASVFKPAAQLLGETKRKVRPVKPQSAQSKVEVVELHSDEEDISSYMADAGSVSNYSSNYNSRSNASGDSTLGKLQFMRASQLVRKK